MPYCALADLQVIKNSKKLAELSGGTGTEPDLTVIAGVIALADGIIDAKLSPRYTVPFSPVPEVIKGISMNLAIAFLYGRNQAAFMPTDIKGQYDKAIGLLDQIAKGEAGLGIEVPASSLGPTITIIDPYGANKFDMNSLEPEGSGDPDFKAVEAE